MTARSDSASDVMNRSAPPASVHGREHFKALVAEEGMKLLQGQGRAILTRAIADIFAWEHAAGEPQLSRDEQYIQLLVRGYVEIAGTLESLGDIAVYVRRFPYPGTSVSRTRHLRHNVESFFHESYLLYNRLLSFLTKLERRLKDRETHERVPACVRRLRALIKADFRDVLDVRGEHVHERRYNDLEFYRLEGFDTLIDTESQDLDAYGTALYRKIRSEWSRRIKSDVRAVELIVDGYFSELLLVLTDTEGRLLYPSR